MSEKSSINLKDKLLELVKQAKEDKVVSYEEINSVIPPEFPPDKLEHVKPCCVKIRQAI